MKKLVFIVFALFVGVAQADNVITSKSYVDTAANNLQEQISANDANTVLTYTGSAGTVGEKAIYDSSAAYGGQQDALVTAGAFNTAVQNALDTEFVCIDWLGDVHDNNHCLLYQIRTTTPKTIIPSGYTQLEYLESTKGQWIDTNFSPSANTRVDYKVKLTEQAGEILIGTRLGSDPLNRFFPIAYGSDNKFRITFGQWESRETINYSQIYTGSYQPANGVIILNGVSHDINVQTARFSKEQNNNLLLFSATGYSNTNGVSASGRIYYTTIYEQGSLVRNFIPARRNSDEELGMYDTVSKTFFTNVGTGTFVAGPAVSSNLYLPNGN